jgi:Zn-dependent protease
MKNSTRYRIIEVLELFAGSILPIIFWISVIFGFDTPYIAILTILSAAIHEIGHYATILYFTEKRTEIRGHTTGFRIKESVMLSYPQEISILLAGPISNIIIFILTLPFGYALSGYLKFFGYINLATGISNLLPLDGYDGYGALSTFFRSRGATHLIKRLEVFSFVFSIAVTFISLHIIDILGEGYWIFGLFFFTMLSKLIKFEKYDIFEE